jgi:hypothetical protein
LRFGPHRRSLASARQWISSWTTRTNEVFPTATKAPPTTALPSHFLAFLPSYTHYTQSTKQHNTTTTTTMTDLQIMNEHSAMMNDKNRDGEIMTGTTIMALPFDGGVVVCADSRTSTGTYVANRVSDKLVQISEKIYCCRSGSAADTQALTDYVHYFLNQWR